MVYYNSVNNNINQPIPARRAECITIGRLAPDFIALSTQGYIRLSDYKGKWVLLASQPVAFRAVATTELISASRIYDEILKRNAVIIGLTTDNVYSNLAWIYDIYQKTGIAVPFPIIADAGLDVSELYGMLNPDRMYSDTVRDFFIINPYGRIQAIVTLPSSCGRNVEELLRILDSLQLTEKYNVHTPANWKPGNPVVLEPSPSTYEELINTINQRESMGLNCPFWYLCYVNLNTLTEVNTENQENPNTINNE